MHRHNFTVRTPNPILTEEDQARLQDRDPDDGDLYTIMSSAKKEYQQAFEKVLERDRKRKHDDKVQEARNKAQATEDLARAADEKKTKMAVSVARTASDRARKAAEFARVAEQEAAASADIAKAAATEAEAALDTRNAKRRVEDAEAYYNFLDGEANYFSEKVAMKREAYDLAKSVLGYAMDDQAAEEPGSAAFKTLASRIEEYTEAATDALDDMQNAEVDARSRQQAALEADTAVGDAKRHLDRAIQAEAEATTEADPAAAADETDTGDKKEEK